MTQPPRSPVPQEVSTELQRVVERWHQLPLDRALSSAAGVRALVQSLADELAEANGIPASPVPDLGPATLMDQLTVLVYDATVAEVASTATATAPSPPTTAPTSPQATPALTSTLAQDLASLRRALR